MSAKATLPWTASESINTLPLNGRYVCLSTLPKGLKQQAWGVLVSQQPGLAELLQSAELKAVVQYFDAEIYVEAEMLPGLPSDFLKSKSRAE